MTGRAGRPRVRGFAALAALAVLVGCRSEPPARRHFGALTVAVPNGIETIDPHLQDTLANFSILGNVYESLVQTDAALQVKPGLAERWESPDPLTWVFSLRKGVRF